MTDDFQNMSHSDKSQTDKSQIDKSQTDKSQTDKSQTDKSQTDNDRHSNSSEESHSESPHHQRPCHQLLCHRLRHKEVIGLNSVLSETLKELSPTFRDINTIASVVRDLDRDALPIFNRVYGEGITNPAEFVKRFLEVEASEWIDARNCMLSDLRQSLAIVLFPLPPHIIELLRPVLNRKFSFNTTEHVPVPIQRDNFPFLDYESFQQLFSVAHDIRYLVLDGLRFQKTLTIRPNAASILELLLTQSLSRIYFHKIPHLPHKERFVTLNIARDKIEIRNI